MRDRMDRNLFDFGELKARTRADNCNIEDLQYADDAATVAQCTIHHDTATHDRDSTQYLS